MFCKSPCRRNMLNPSIYGSIISSFFTAFCRASNTNPDPTMTGWVWNNGPRSTFDILWSCLSIIIICTWKVVHLHIPAEDEANASWLHRLFWKKWARKFKWMFLMALSPELLYSMALRDWLWSRASLQEFKKLSLRNPCAARRLLCTTADDSVIQPGSFVNHEGLKITENLNDSIARSWTQMSERRWTIVHAHYANMGGFRLRFPQTDPPPRTAESTYSPVEGLEDQSGTSQEYHSFPVSADELLELVENFSLEVPYIHRRNIEDRSKSDVIAKAFAIGQSLWLIIGSIARAAQGLPITELELTTMGFVGCALVLYFLWWHKPFDVEHSIPIDCPLQDRNKILTKLRALFEAKYTSRFLAPSWEDYCKDRRIKNWAYMNGLYPLSHATWVISTLSIMLYGIVFSAIHISAWNWIFPTRTEQLLWRASSVTATSALFPVAVLLPLLGNGGKAWQERVVRGFIAPLIHLYVIARLILIVQCFICFRDMPEAVYQNVTWTYYLPQFS